MVFSEIVKEDILTLKAMKKFTLPADKLPSCQVALTFREPMFQDRREVTRRFSPNQGYSLDELLVSTCLVAVNGQELSAQPQDPMDILRELPQADEQYVLLVFLSMFTLDEELSEVARQIGTKFKLVLEQQHTITRDQMPSKSYSVTFRKLTSGERMKLERRYPGSDSNCGYSFDEMLFAYSVTAIDGNPVEAVNPKDVISTLDDWTHLDFQFASTVFLNAVTVDRDDANEAKQLGKSLRQEMEATFSGSGKSASSSRKKVGSTAGE